ncbi:hypothetical protein FDECE_6603 [Fusarium decemcellulare]|nr:hypothetical protein FDECE_6603 [Fusarium decemcellulare]
MPVTLSVVNHAAEAWSKEKVRTPEDLFNKACPRDSRRSQRIMQSSFSRRELRESHVTPSENGFFWAAYHAYSTHHHLTIRPEDVWFSILTQLSFYIVKNAEKLRSFFVEHEGQKELEVMDEGSLEYANFGALAVRMTGLIEKNVKDPELRAWVMPEFSTTTDTDKVVAAILFMGVMQKYFTYKMSLTCGIPSVTLLGEVSDWEIILSRLDKLEQLGDEPTKFAEMLRPIIRHMILSFTEPTSPKVLDFWNTIATHNPVGSGTDFISGWMTAFCFWDEDGNCKPRFRKQSLTLEGVRYPTVNIDKVPVGFASVPVNVNDNGDSINCTMLAGSLGIQARSLAATNTEEASGDPTEALAPDSLQPLTGWIMFEKEPSTAAEDRAKEKASLEEQLNAVMDQRDKETNEERSKLFEKQLSIMRRMEELEAF